MKDEQDEAGAGRRNVPGSGGEIQETWLIKSCPAMPGIQAGFSGRCD